VLKSILPRALPFSKDGPAFMEVRRVGSNIMKYLLVSAALLAMPGSALAARCLPAESDVVSLGEKAARVYAERSLDTSIAQRQQLLETMGETAPGAINKNLDCKPFPNVLGADEWRCVGSAKVCGGKAATEAKPKPPRQKNQEKKK
jgi:hypothetical protein